MVKLINKTGLALDWARATAWTPATTTFYVEKAGVYLFCGRTGSSNKTVFINGTTAGIFCRQDGYNQNVHMTIPVIVNDGIRWSAKPSGVDISTFIPYLSETINLES